MTEPDASAEPARPDLSFLDAAAHTRARSARTRTWLALSFAVLVTVTWLVVVLATGLFPRVWSNIVAAPTMLFGSFVAGATPQGGGAVAFPVFTKGLGIPSEVARTFSLAIQSIGMTSAAFAILVRQRAVSAPAILWSIPPGLVGLFGGFWLLSNTSLPFWPSVLPGVYVKVGFTLLVLVMAFVVYLGTRVPVREVRTRLTPLTARQVAFIVVAALIGGFATSQVGSGVDVLLYLAVVVILGLEPRVAVPSSVIVMAILSIVGFVYLGLIQGHFFLTIDDGLVTAVGGVPLADPENYPVQRFDLFGLWLAAVPIVCWGAPIGSAFAARITSRQLALFVVALAAIEATTTIIFVPELRSDPGVIAFAVIGGSLLLLLLWLSVRARHRVAGVWLDTSRSLSREHVDVSKAFGQSPSAGRRGRARSRESKSEGEST